MPRLSELSESVRLTEPVAGYPVFEIDHPCCRARVALHGAQVMEWQPATADHPVLYLSPDAVLEVGKAIRGGIPVCWPWFNAHPTDPSQPSHGFARIQLWELMASSEDEAQVSLGFSLEVHPLRARLHVSLGTELHLALETENIGSAPAPLSGALHGYLGVGDVRRAEIHGLEGSDYLDTVGERVIRRQPGKVIFEGETDRIYESDRSVLLDDPAMGRSIIVEKEGSPSTVVWNPWKEKAAALPDLPDDGYHHFVCIETAIANERAIVLAPGGRHTLATTLRVEER